MLVLSRKVGERLLIGENVVVQLIRIKGNQVQLGITAPTEMRVWREEIYPGPEAPPKEEVA